LVLAIGSFVQFKDRDLLVGWKLTMPLISPFYGHIFSFAHVADRQVVGMARRTQARARS
jgi:hypothetical protein